MPTKICDCEGLNAQCPKCFGSGYIEVSAPTQTQTQPPQKRKTLLPEDVSALSGAELDNLLAKLIGTIDEKSRKQMQLLNSIPFNTTAFRRDFKEKFELLSKLENDKKFLRKELDAVLTTPAAKKVAKHLSFDHFLSDKELDATSNRQLKTLIREYKKLKNSGRK